MGTNLVHYEVRREGPDSNVFGFFSEGPKGRFEKAVVFTRIASTDFYNLGLGDVVEATGELDDLAITDNGDTLTVLATVAAIVIAFTEQQPRAKIYATGSTTSRTRLYRMGLTTHLPEMEVMFDIFGFRDGYWEPFQKLVSYEAFYVVRKT